MSPRAHDLDLDPVIDRVVAEATAPSTERAPKRREADDTGFQPYPATVAELRGGQLRTVHAEAVRILESRGMAKHRAIDAVNRGEGMAETLARVRAGRAKALARAAAAKFGDELADGIVAAVTTR
ncbi:hypothetical protein [Microbacterium aureliae]